MSISVLLLALLPVLAWASPAAAAGAPGPPEVDGVSYARFFAEQRRGVDYDGRIVDGAGRPLDGSFSLELRYFGSGPAALFAERFDAVTIEGGRFRIHLGAGEPVAGGRYRSLAEVFSALSDAHVEVAVNGRVYGPRLEILPAGHSLESRLVAAGVREPVDGRPHWEGYSSPGGATAVEAAVLAPLTSDGAPGGASAAGSAAGSAAAGASGLRVRRHPFTLPVIGPMLSRPARDLAVVRTKSAGAPREINPRRQESLVDAAGHRYGTVAPKIDDSLVGRLGPAASSPSVGLSFDGIPNLYGDVPPDPEAAVGPNDYVEVVNTLFTIYDKTGHVLAGPSATNTLWAGFTGPCETDDSGDAIFLYDDLADRFIFAQLAVAGSHQSVCFAVSQTSDPTGAFYLYEVVTPRFPDYFKVGVWPDPDNDAYFFATNSGSQGAYDVFAVDRAHMLAGTAARSVQFFQSFDNFMMPADLDGPDVPPAGSPGLFYTFRDGGEPYFNSPPTDSLDLWEFHVDWTTPANSTISLAQSFTPASGLADFNWTVCGFFVANCIPQPDTTQGLDSLSEWPMQRLVYRNFGSYEALAGSWTVNVVPQPGIRAAPRWFELRNTGSGWSIYQQGTQSPDAIDRWMPSVAMDKAGDLALGYNRGDGTHFPSLYYATRTPADSLGTLETEALLYAGTGSQTGGGSRWGDYSSLEIDPADDCSFWYTSEYLATTSRISWRTRVGKFTVPGCLPSSSPPTDLVLSDDTLVASTTYEACNSITLGPNLFFTAGAPGVVIRAPKIIFVPEVGTLAGAVAVFDDTKPADCP